jgi:hypothetical protein
VTPIDGGGYLLSSASGGVGFSSDDGDDLLPIGAQLGDGAMRSATLKDCVGE